MTIKHKDGEQTIMPRNSCHIMVDERIGYKVSNFYDTKSGMVEPPCALFEKWQQVDIAVTVVKQEINRTSNYKHGQGYT